MFASTFILSCFCKFPPSEVGGHGFDFKKGQEIAAGVLVNFPLPIDARSFFLMPFFEAVGRSYLIQGRSDQFVRDVVVPSSGRHVVSFLSGQWWLIGFKSNLRL